MYLFKVTINARIGSGIDYQNSYVVADSMDEAYSLVKKFLDKEDICFSDERELKSVSLIADTDRYPKCGTLLFISDKVKYFKDKKVYYEDDGRK